MGVTLIKSSDKFSKKRYAHKLYVVKSYAKFGVYKFAKQFSVEGFFF